MSFIGFYFEILVYKTRKIPFSCTSKVRGKGLLFPLRKVVLYLPFDIQISPKFIKISMLLDVARKYLLLKWKRNLEHANMYKESEIYVGCFALRIGQASCLYIQINF